MIWNVPAMWKDSTCYVIGGGPSLFRQFDIPDEVIEKVRNNEEHPSIYSPFLKDLHTKHVIGVNCAYMLGSWVDVLFFGDSQFLITNGRDIFSNYKNIRCTCSTDDRAKLAGIKYVMKNKKKKYGITTTPGMLSWNNNSGPAAINLAAHFGVKRIILLGFDMTLDVKQRQHWHNKYATPLKKVEGTFSQHIKGFPFIAEDAKKLGIEIINANPDSRIDCFPRVPLKEVL